MTAFIDARREEVPDVLQSAVCIIGSGAAGITLARRLARTGQDVILVEAGGFDLDGETQLLFAGEQLGLPYFNLLSCRLRYFGGTTNHWAGYCRANDPIDYEGRSTPDLPPWPIGHDDLAPYIEEAGNMLGVEALHFDPRRAMAARGLEAETLAEDTSDILQTKVFLYARNQRLGPLHRAELEASPTLDGYLHLNLVHIQLNAEGNRVEHVRCRTLEGREVRVEARFFALCCHGIENARILMHSDDVQTGGIGNAGDHLGRYFMDHITVTASRFVPTPAFSKVYNRTAAAAADLNANIGFTDDLLREAGLLQYYCRFNPVYVAGPVRRAMRHIQEDAMEPGDLDFLRDVARVATDMSGAARLALAVSGRYTAQPDYFNMEHRLEQAPNPASRVVLSDRRDALGQRIADLHWAINDDDVASFQKGQQIIGRELSALGWGRMEEDEITADFVRARVKGHYHQIGTTRMSETEAQGVVNADCRVHGVDNLYVGGSSVFPTAGYSGPTMMIIAMAMRLADHLEGRLA